MQVSASTARVVGRAAWIGAWVGVMLAPIHALGRFATLDGQEDLENPVTRMWAEPAAQRLRPLLDWSDPDTVYISYGKGWFPLFLAATACAFVVRRSRAPRGLERIAWPVMLAGLVIATASVVGDYYTPWLDESFLFLGVPGLLVSLLGSLLLGIALLRRGFRPRATGWLLVLWFPLVVVLSSVVAMGAAALPMLFAWGLAGHAMSSTLQQEHWSGGGRPWQQPSALCLDDQARGKGRRGSGRQRPLRPPRDLQRRAWRRSGVKGIEQSSNDTN